MTSSRLPVNWPMSVWLRAQRDAVFAFVVVSFMSSFAFGAADDDDMAIAQSLAEMLRDARTVISNEQDRINNPQLADKHLTGEVVLDQAIASYIKATGTDPRKVGSDSRRGRLMRAMMQAIVEATDDNQGTINEKGIGFKGFIPAVFARLVAENFVQLAKGEAEIKVTAPPQLVRNRKARPDQLEAEVIKTKFLEPTWPTGQAYSVKVEANGRPAFRMMVPEYYSESCLACHGTPKGEMDITGYPKEGGKLNDLGAVISITLYD